MFNQKRKYFKHKLNGVQKMIWDLEFKKEKSLMIREEVRREYDGVQAKLGIIKSRIESNLEDPKKICEIHNPEQGKEKVHKDKGTCICAYREGAMPVADIENLYDEKERLTQDKQRYEIQMRRIDLDVQGSVPTNEYPEGFEGINSQMDALRELKEMIKQYLVKI